ncbi:MAG: aminotransferase class I/II-fold pyridoxal phosphate-dependent enzyme [Chitinophagaceae bacterium]|nr:aminotransferase class I/II-fold pyridoxal phosphate-dependent enzyme [Chitinophagaceae bacterium]MBK9661343.1 aminotransferase class I/II-fold pyridoxal phosphate-dependent enzyme [Chitinophagaceae bacterium]MBP6234377.1 aminotransferase class I/II-fold pyridoxal phosphate-dependent enzyme [Chitinophagaceae bacterium]MBP6416425.1 aminotransferase class I/II-fold pyridoxal phosphate-dependent enzyme [Chitinophagaceae bacterium]
MHIQSKLPNVGTTIFSVMSALSTEHNAVNLGQGFPDFPMSDELTGLVNEAMRNNFNQYSPMPGWMPLREAIAEKVEFLYSTKINPDTETTITPGGTYAIYSALTTILQPGDEVIVFEPAYDSYIPNIEINGAKAVPISLVYPDYHIDWVAVQNAITPKTKAIIINSPHNPTGSVINEEDIQQLRKITAGTNIFIISDEVYEHLIFDDIPHQSTLRYPDLLQRSFVCFSFGKTYNCTGWKLGYCIAPAGLTKEFRKVHQFNCFSCHTPSQVGLALFLKNRDAYLSLPAFMQEKRDYFKQLMQQTRFTMHDSFGSYFICGSYERISEEADKDLAIRLTKEAGVATIPVSAFYHHGKDDKVLRFCFSKKKETLEMAVEKLSRF